MSAPDRTRGFLIGAKRKGVWSEDLDESLDELSELLQTAGGTEIGRLACDLPNVHPATFIGKGKLAELKELCAAEDVDFLLFDDDLSPTQQRNIEEAVEKMVMDRTGLILDIFAMRARSSEGKLQVELAQLEYLLPRLRGLWTHLSRQGAGIGTRGPGETDLEIDRRRIQERILMLKRRLKKVSRTRELHRDARERIPFETAGLIGYTNAGKSTLFNALTTSEVAAENKLFATLDPTTRLLRLPENHRLLVSDTVGFIRKLPHQLVASFKATFEEAAGSRYLLHVIDAAHPGVEQRIESVHAVMAEIGLDSRELIPVLNKADLCASPAALARLARMLPGAVVVSAKTGEGLDELRGRLVDLLRSGRRRVDVAIPIGRGDLLHALHREASIVSESYDETLVSVSAWVPPRLYRALAQYVQ